MVKADKDKELVNKVKYLYDEKTNSESLEFKNSFFLERGPFDLVSVLEESINEEPYIVKGLLIDLFDPKLPVLTEKKVMPGEQAFLFNIGRVENSQEPQILASASRAYNEEFSKGKYSFIVKSPINTTNSMRILLPTSPNEIAIKETKENKDIEHKYEWDEMSKTCWLEFENSPDGIKVNIRDRKSVV